MVDENMHEISNRSVNSAFVSCDDYWRITAPFKHPRF